MRILFRRILSVAIACTLGGVVYAQEEEINTERDIQAVKEFIQCKRAIYIDDIGGNLSLSGDVRGEWQWKREVHDGQKLRGSGSGNPSKGSNEYDVEFNLYLDYVTECTWATVQIQFDNNAGTFNCTSGSNGVGSADCQTGNCDGVCLKKAYMGYNILDVGCSRLDLEVGRRNMYHVFDSRVQFNDRLDGIVLRYTNSFEGIAEFYANGAVFVIDSANDHYGYAIEAGLLNIADMGVDFKYSYQDRELGGVDRSGSKDPESFYHRRNEFRNSQFTGIFHLDPEWLRCDFEVYAGVVINHAARKRADTNNKKENIAWYIGARFGGVKNEGDWSVDVNYQHVEAQSIHDCDMSGIGRGNCSKIAFPHNTAFGNTNFQGFQIEGVYALTDNITLSLEIEWADEENSSIGGDHEFRKVRSQIIYGF